MIHKLVKVNDLNLKNFSEVNRVQKVIALTRRTEGKNGGKKVVYFLIRRISDVQ